MIHLDGETAHDAWLSITDHLGRGHFDHSVFGLVHEYGPESRLSLVLAADQVNFKLQFKPNISDCQFYISFRNFIDCTALVNKF